MVNIFLQAATIKPEDFMAGGIGGAFIAFILAFLLIFAILLIAVYIYSSLAFMAIARKTKTGPAGIAWIPAVGPALIARKIAKMHWWPILLLIGFWIPFIGIALWLVFGIFFVIWMWKTFEAVGKPGWWAIFIIIPIVQIVFFVLLGIAAWSKK